MPGLADNLARVRERIAAAASRSGRTAGDIALVAITKGCGPEVVRGLWDLGLRDFGENRVQEALAKVELDLPGARWHLVGHLQENKINKVLGWVFQIQSIDSVELARAVDRRAQRDGLRVPVLLEVKTSSEPAKHGVAVEAAVDAFGQLAACPGLEPRGLMTVAPYVAAENELRRCFAALRRLGESIARATARAPVLSMGMSDDFEIAIEEGTTCLRLGRVLVRG